MIITKNWLGRSPNHPRPVLVRILYQRGFRYALYILMLRNTIGLTLQMLLRFATFQHILLARLMRRWSAISDTLLDWKLFMLRRLPPSPSQRLPLEQKDSGASDDTVHELDVQQEINWCANSYESV
jgi:hypothetical protein